MKIGNRKIIKNNCEKSDWENYGLKAPKDYYKYSLTQCLNCFKCVPAKLDQLKRNPPKRCRFCSNIGIKNNEKSNTNSWTLFTDYAGCYIKFKNQYVLTIIDKEFYDIANKYIWRIVQKKNKYYAITGSSRKNTAIYMHKFILGNPEIPNGYEIDHIDGNSLNNRKNNLRIVSRIQNIQNSKARIDNQIGIRGVSYVKTSKKYKVDFSYNNKRYYFSDFNTIEEAIYCRKIAENHFGLNMIDRNPIAIDHINNTSDNLKEKIYNYTLSIINNK